MNMKMRINWTQNKDKKVRGISVTSGLWRLEFKGENKTKDTQMKDKEITGSETEGVISWKV